jgi:hypothetical protein
LQMFEFNNFVTAGEFFLEIVGELILIFVAVSFLIGLLTEYLPPSRIRDFLSGRFTWVQYLLGAGLGAITPFCSCSTVPITAGLLRGGVPFGPTMAFLFSSPVLNPVIIALLLSLLGYKVTVVYVAVTFLGSMAAAFLLSKLGMEGQVKPLMNVQAACCAETGKPDLVSLSPRNQSAAAGCCSPGSVQTSPLITLTAMQSSAANRGREARRCAEAGSSDSCTINRSAVAVSDGAEPFQEKDEEGIVVRRRHVQGCSGIFCLGQPSAPSSTAFSRRTSSSACWAGQRLVHSTRRLGVPMCIRAETVIPKRCHWSVRGWGRDGSALIIGEEPASRK